MISEHDSDESEVEILEKPLVQRDKDLDDMPLRSSASVRQFWHVTPTGQKWLKEWKRQIEERNATATVR